MGAIRTQTKKQPALRRHVQYFLPPPAANMFALGNNVNILQLVFHEFSISAVRFGD